MIKNVKKTILLIVLTLWFALIGIAAIVTQCLVANQLIK